MSDSISSQQVVSPLVCQLALVETGNNKEVALTYIHTKLKQLLEEEAKHKHAAQGWRHGIFEKQGVSLNLQTFEIAVNSQTLKPLPQAIREVDDFCDVFAQIDETSKSVMASSQATFEHSQFFLVEFEGTEYRVESWSKLHTKSREELACEEDARKWLMLREHACVVCGRKTLAGNHDGQSVKRLPCRHVACAKCITVDLEACVACRAPIPSMAEVEALPEAGPSAASGQIMGNSALDCAAADLRNLPKLVGGNKLLYLNEHYSPIPLHSETLAVQAALPAAATWIEEAFIPRLRSHWEALQETSPSEAPLLWVRDKEDANRAGHLLVFACPSGSSLSSAGCYLEVFRVPGGFNAFALVELGRQMHRTLAFCSDYRCTTAMLGRKLESDSNCCC